MEIFINGEYVGDFKIETNINLLQRETNPVNPKFFVGQILKVTTGQKFIWKNKEDRNYLYVKVVDCIYSNSYKENIYKISWLDTKGKIISTYTETQLKNMIIK